MTVKRSTAAFKVLLCGYYGEHNLGDDALLHVLLGAIPPSWDPLVTVHDAEAVMAMYPGIATVPRRSLRAAAAAVFGVDALVLGGGSLLQDSTSFKSLLYYLLLIGVARLRGIPVILWGQGLGPLHRPLSRWLVRCVLPWVQAIGWRDPTSEGLANRWGIQVPSLMAADPVWSFPGLAWQGDQMDGEQRSGVVLCWRPTPLLSSTQWNDLLRAVERLAIQQGLPVTWLAFHQHQDHHLPTTLAREGLMSTELAARSRFLVAESLPQVMGLFSRSQFVIAMRLHALILAQLAGAPCAALSYDPKVAAAAQMAGVLCDDLEALPSADTLFASWRGVVEQPADGSSLARIKTDAARHGALLQDQLIKQESVLNQRHRQA